MRKPLLLLFAFIVSLSSLAGCSNASDAVLLTDLKPQQALIETKPAVQLKDLTGFKSAVSAALNQLAGVSMLAKIGTVLPSGLTLELSNDTDLRCVYGLSYYLEQRVAGKWNLVPTLAGREHIFSSVGLLLDSGEVREQTVNWAWLYGKLSAGEYRIVKTIIDSRSPGDFDTYRIATEFSVSPSPSSLPTARAVLESPIVRTAYLSLDQVSKDSCLDWMAAEVESYTVPHFNMIILTPDKTNLGGRVVWQVIFRTKDEWLFGSITVYVDKESGNVLGCGARY